MSTESDLPASDSWNSRRVWGLACFAVGVGALVGALILWSELDGPNQSPPVITYTYSCAAGDGLLVYDMSHGEVVSAFEQSSAGSAGISDELVWESIDVLHRTHIAYAPRYRPASKMLRELSYIGVCDREDRGDWRTNGE